MPSARSSLLGFLTALLLFAAACGGRPRPLIPLVPLRTATLPGLVADFNHNAGAINTLSLKLQLVARVGKTKEPAVTGFLLMQKPANIRLWGNFTLFGRIFDMVSDGTTFELSIPSKNEFIEGRDDVVPEKVKNPLEKIRPQVILNALLINPILPSQRAALDPGSANNQYVILVLQPGEGGFYRLMRRITYSRYDLLPERQVIYDADGKRSTIATYSKYIDRQGIPIPQDVYISRPVEGYSLHLQLDAKNILVNVSLNPNPFFLKPPPGSTIIKLSAIDGASVSGPSDH